MGGVLKRAASSLPKIFLTNTPFELSKESEPRGPGFGLSPEGMMFEDGKWQPLRPHELAFGGHKRVGLTEFHFGPEIAFGHEMAKGWPTETIGVIKFSIGGTSLLLCVSFSARRASAS